MPIQFNNSIFRPANIKIRLVEVARFSIMKFILQPSSRWQSQRRESFYLTIRQGTLSAFTFQNQVKRPDSSAPGGANVHLQHNFSHKSFYLPKPCNYGLQPYIFTREQPGQKTGFLINILMYI